MTTRVLNSLTTKEKKKKFLSSTTQLQPLVTDNPEKSIAKVELKKHELIGLLARLEGELQGKELVIATLQSQNLRTQLLNYRFGFLGSTTAPSGTLVRDSYFFKTQPTHESHTIKQNYDMHIVYLKKIIKQQKAHIDRLKNVLQDLEKRIFELTEISNKQKSDQIHLQASHNQLSIVLNEKLQLQNQLSFTQLQNKELEQQLLQTTNLLEQQHERHKRFVVLFLNERKVENQHFNEQIQQLSKNHSQQISQMKKQYQNVKIENEREKEELRSRIKWLQDEIDSFIQEKNKKSIVHSPDQLKTAKPQTTKVDPVIGSPVVSILNELSPPQSREKIPVSTTKSQDTSYRTAISSPLSPRGNETIFTKMDMNHPAVLKRASHSSSMIDLSSSGNTPMRGPAIPIRPKSEDYRSSTLKALHLSLSNTQDDNQLLRKNIEPAVESTISNKQTKSIQQTNISTENRNEEGKTTLNNVNTVNQNRPPIKTRSNDIASNSNEINNDTSKQANAILIRAAESGDTAQLLKFLKLGVNPNYQTSDGNTCLHLSLANGHIECLHHLLKYGANPYLENNLGINAWKNLSKLQEKSELECLYVLIDQNQVMPPIDLILTAIEQNRLGTFNYLFALLKDQLKNNSIFMPNLLRSALRCTNIHFITSISTLINTKEAFRLIDENTFISNECRNYLKNLEKKEDEQRPKPIPLNVHISSAQSEHHYSYAIGRVFLTPTVSWRELERFCTKIFTEHITEIDSPFDYGKSSIQCSTSNIDTIALGQIKWLYQDSPDDSKMNPYVVARDQQSVTLYLKNFQNNATDSLAYNYFIPSQHLKNFISFIEQNQYVGVYGAPYLQKKSLFSDLVRYLERPTPVSSVPKFRLIQFEIEIVTCLDEIIDELVDQEFFHYDLESAIASESHQSIKVLLYFANIQNSLNYEVLNLLMNSQIINDRFFKISYTREDDPSSTANYYFSSNFHILITLSRRAWPAENEICKRFKWIAFKIDTQPWNGQLKRHLWRRMVHTNVLDDRSIDNELITTLQWITNIWQRYNECLQKLSLQDAVLGPALFFDCPMERPLIFEWLQNKWNSIIAPLVREHSMNKSTPQKSKYLETKANAPSGRDTPEPNATFESTACRALYVLLQRTVSRDCPLTGIERDQYLMNFMGSRLEGNGSSTGNFSSLNVSAASSRTGTPQ